MPLPHEPPAHDIGTPDDHDEIDGDVGQGRGGRGAAGTHSAAAGGLAASEELVDDEDPGEDSPVGRPGATRIALIDRWDEAPDDDRDSRTARRATFADPGSDPAGSDSDPAGSDPVDSGAVDSASSRVASIAAGARTVRGAAVAREALGQEAPGDASVDPEGVRRGGSGDETVRRARVADLSDAGTRGSVSPGRGRRGRSSTSGQSSSRASGDTAGPDVSGLRSAGLGSTRSRDGGDSAPEPDADESVPGTRGGRAGSRRGARTGGRPTAGGRVDRARGRRAAGAGDAEADPVAQAKTICLRLLEARSRTRQELAQALRRKEIPDEAAETVLARFSEVGLIDDTAFAGQWVRSRHTYSGLGRRAIAMELRRKGVDSETAGEALAEVDDESEEARARALVDRKLRTRAGAPDEAMARRLLGMLARKGYPGGVAYRVVKAAVAEHAAELAEQIPTGDDL